jgi:hypothetical protein
MFTHPSAGGQLARQRQHEMQAQAGHQRQRRCVRSGRDHVGQAHLHPPGLLERLLPAARYLRGNTAPAPRLEAGWGDPADQCQTGHGLLLHVRLPELRRAFARRS